MSRRSKTAVVAGAGLLMLTGCVDGRDPMGLERARTVTVLAAPSFALVPTASELAALDLLRVTLRDSGSGGSVIAQREVSILPSDPEWGVGLTVELAPDQILSLYLETELIDTGVSPASAEWSGRTESFEVRASLEPLELGGVDLYRGPLGNLDLESVMLSTPALTLLQGASARLEWSVPGDAAGAVMYFGARDTTIARVDSEGRVEARGAGSTDVFVFGGTVRDSLSLTVLPVTLPSLGEIEATIIPQIDYVTSDLFVATFQDAAGAGAIRDSMSSLGEALLALQGPEAVGHFEGAVGAWESYGAGTNLRFVDGPQLGVIELTLVHISTELHLGFP